MEIIDEPQKKNASKKIKKEKKLRKVLNKIINSECKINIVEKCDSDGDIIFEVPMKSVGITYDLLINCKGEISSEFVGNFLGEFLVRENIEQFASVITGLKSDYMETVNKYMHQRFGIRIYRDKFIFKFNISLIQKILMEDFRKQLV